FGETYRRNTIHHTTRFRSEMHGESPAPDPGAPPTVRVVTGTAGTCQRKPHPGRCTHRTSQNRRSQHAGHVTATVMRIHVHRQGGMGMRQIPDTSIVGQEATFGVCSDVFGRHQFHLGGNWDYDHGSFDRILAEDGEATIYVR